MKKLQASLMISLLLLGQALSAEDTNISAEQPLSDIVLDTVIEGSENFFSTQMGCIGVAIPVSIGAVGGAVLRAGGGQLFGESKHQLFSSIVEGGIVGAAVGLPAGFLVSRHVISEESFSLSRSIYQEDKCAHAGAMAIVSTLPCIFVATSLGEVNRTTAIGGCAALTAAFIAARGLRKMYDRQ